MTGLEVHDEQPLEDAGVAADAVPSQELDDHDGRWVAVRGGRIVAAGADEASVRAHPAVRDGDLVYGVGEPASGFYLLNV